VALAAQAFDYKDSGSEKCLICISDLDDKMVFWYDFAGESFCLPIEMLPGAHHDFRLPQQSDSRQR